MRGVIFGSGIIGLMAKALLPTWTVIPFMRSRFFTFNPALDDNFIIADDKIDEAVRDIVQVPVVQKYRYKRAFDVNGQLFHNYDKGLCSDWLGKIFGLKVPPQAAMYMSGCMGLTVYDIRINNLYAGLLSRCMSELKDESQKGAITEIGDHFFVRNGIKEEFDNAISTVPLPILYKLMNVSAELPTKTAHFLHVETDSLDFEGNNQVLVTSPLFSFYKVTNIAPNRFMFYLHEEISNPGQYLMALLRRFNIIDGTTISDYLTLGATPNIDWLEPKGIYCIGSYAQHDWCMDVSSCILRLIRYMQRDLKAAKKVPI